MILRKTTAFLVVAVWSTCTIFVEARAQVKNPDALRQIVQEQCVLNWRTPHNPFPCARMSLPSSGNAEGGFAVLHDSYLLQRVSRVFVSITEFSS
jgi:CDP-diacylglycerol pyrophosphatase